MKCPKYTQNQNMTSVTTEQPKRDTQTNKNILYYNRGGFLLCSGSQFLWILNTASGSKLYHQLEAKFCMFSLTNVSAVFLLNVSNEESPLSLV